MKKAFHPLVRTGIIDLASDNRNAARGHRMREDLRVNGPRLNKPAALGAILGGGSCRLALTDAECLS